MVLQSIRDRLSGIVAIFIFGILIIPFAFVGVNSYFQSDAVNAVAVVNDKEITVNEFNNGFQNYRRRMQAQMGTAFDADMFDQPIIRRQYLEQMIDEELMAQVSVDAGLAVDNQVLAERIRNIEAFNVDGEFNTDVYQARLAAQGMSPKQFEEETRVSMILNQFPTSIINSAIVTNWELNDYVRLNDQQRSFKALLVPAAPAVAEGEEEATVGAVEEDAILAWYEEHKSEYRSAEKVTIEYLELDAATLGGAVDLDEEELKARFEEQKSRFITPEARLASHILIEVPQGAPEVDVESARQQAEDLAERAGAGEDFAALAKEYSQDVGSAEAGGDLGWVEPGFMVQAFENGLYDLSLEHPVSDPVQTGFGWHVIYLRDIRPAEGMSYTEARDTLVEEITAETDERRFLEQADRLVDIIYEDPTTLDAAANELGLEVKVAGPFGRQGGDSGIDASMVVVNAAFSDLVLSQGVVSDPIALGENHIALIRLLEHFPEAQLPLEDVREQVVAGVRKQRALDAAAARAEELLASLTGGATIDELAESSGLELVQAEAAKRTDPAIAPDLRAKIFLMETPGDNGPVTAVLEMDSGYAVVELDSVKPGELSEDDVQLKAAYQRRIAAATGNTEIFGFVKMLRAQSEIKVFEDRF